MKWFRSRRKAVDAPSNFTPRAQQALALARKEAGHFHHNFVGTEHVLLGIIALAQGTAAAVLKTIGIDLEAVRREILVELGHQILRTWRNAGL